MAPEEIMACGKRVWPGREWRISPDALIVTAEKARSMDVVVCGAAGDARIYDPTTGADAWDALMWMTQKCWDEGFRLTFEVDGGITVDGPEDNYHVPGSQGVALVRMIADWPAGR